MEWLIAGLAFLAAVLAVAGFGRLAGRDRVRARLGLWTALAGREAAAEWASAAFWRRLAAWTRPFQRLSAPRQSATSGSAETATPSGPIAAVPTLALRLAQAGIRHPQAVGAFFGLKALLALALPTLVMVGLAAFSLPLRGALFPAVLLAGAVVGYYGPNAWLAHRIRQRQRMIFEAFPDALDLMTVCVEAGLGTEGALVKVGQDLSLQCPALADELRLVNLELRAGAGRESAWRRLAQRTGVDEVDAFVTLMLQAERFGTPMAQALRVHSQSLRTLRRQRAEEAAAKIALKLLFPLIFCIFPSLMVVLMGPAMIQIHRVLLPSMSGSG